MESETLAEKELDISRLINKVGYGKYYDSLFLTYVSKKEDADFSKRFAQKIYEYIRSEVVCEGVDLDRADLGIDEVEKDVYHFTAVNPSSYLNRLQTELPDGEGGYRKVDLKCISIELRNSQDEDFNGLYLLPETREWTMNKILKEEDDRFFNLSRTLDDEGFMLLDEVPQLDS